MRILLVEDDAATARVFCRLLRLSGYQVSVAEGYRSALSLAAQQEFDLLICDIGLPDGSGLDLMRELAATSEVKGIAVSGFTAPSDMADCERAGFIAYVPKPATFETIAEKIAAVVSLVSK